MKTFAQSSVGITLLAASVLLGACEEYPVPHPGTELVSPAGAKARLKPLSGPITLRFNDLFPGERTAQAAFGFQNPGVGRVARQIEVRLYVAKGEPRARAADNMTPVVDELTTQPVIATASVRNGSVAPFTLPAIPSGPTVLQVNVFDTTKTLYDPGTGAADSDAADHLCAQGEGYILAQAAIPADAPLTLYRTIPADQNLSEASLRSVVQFAGPTGSTLFLRMANWNPITELISNGGAENQKLRLTIVAPRPFSAKLASASTSAGWSLGHLGAPEGFMRATASFCVPGGAPSAAPWAWGDKDRKVIFADIDLAAAVPDYAAMYVGGASEPKVGNLSLVLPTTFLPAGYTLSLTDMGSTLTLPSTLDVTLAPKSSMGGTLR